MMKFVKATIIAVTIFSAGSAIGQEATKVEPGKGPTDAVTNEVPKMTPDATAAPTNPASENAKINCTTVDIDATNAKIKAMTDTAKQKMAMDHMDMAKKSMGTKDMAGCEMHMKEAMGSMDTKTK